MQVKDLILYQVATDRDYKVGEKIYFGESRNGQYNNCMNVSFNLNGEPLHKFGFKHLKHGLFKDKKLILEMSKALNNYDFIMREFALEEVRKEKFSYLPSRFSCMFLSDDEEVCLHNFNDFLKKDKGNIFQAIKVKVNGEVHFVKDYGVNRLGLSFNEYKEEAVKYWSQDQNSKSATKEILFKGEAEIIEILKEFKKS